MNPRIGLVVIAHRDYQVDIALDMARETVERLCTSRKSLGGGPGDKLASALRPPEIVWREEAVSDPIRARELAVELAGKDLDGVIFYLGTWIECPVAVAAIRELEHLPFAVWGFPQFGAPKQSTGSLVAELVLAASLERMGYRFSKVTGLPGDEAAIEAGLAFARAAHAVKGLKRLRVGLFGYAAMGMYTGTVDHLLLRRILGPEIVHFDTYSLIREAEKSSRAEIEATVAELGRLAELGGADDALLTKAAILFIGLRKLTEQHRLDAVNVKCQYELSQEYGSIACIPCSLAAESGVVASCEGDVPTTVTMAALHLLTGRAVAYGDLLDYTADSVLLSSCGFLPMSLAKSKPRILDIGHPGFEGLIVSAVFEEGPVTLARFYETRGGFGLIASAGEVIQSELRGGRFPAARVCLSNVPTLLDRMPSQHLALCYGDVTRELALLCRFLGVEFLEVK